MDKLKKVAFYVFSFVILAVCVFVAVFSLGVQSQNNILIEKVAYYEGRYIADGAAEFCVRYTSDGKPLGFGNCTYYYEEGGN